MRNLFIIFLWFFLQYPALSQHQCSRESVQSDQLGSMSTAKSMGWAPFSLLTDEFSASVLDSLKWEVYNNYCIDDLAYFRNDLANCHIENGKLILTTTKLNTPFVCPNSSQTKNYASAWVLSKNAFQYGLIEISCKMPHDGHLNPSFWLYGSVWPGNYVIRYDEIDVFESVFNLYSNKIFRQNVWRQIYPIPPIGDTILQVDEKSLLYQNTYSDNDMVLTVEWLPKEINFFVNGHWTNGVKYTTDKACISPINVNPRSIFTCVEFQYACAQKVQLSLSLHTLIGIPNLSESFEINWIRSYKLVESMIPDYWPTSILPSSNELSTVHSTVRLGGDLKHNGYVPGNSKTTFWAKNSITLDKGFTLSSGSDFELRCIETESPLFLNSSTTK